MNSKEIRDFLTEQRDDEYRAFVIKLIPGIDESTVLGVRAPKLKALAKCMIKDGSYRDFLSELPHKFHEENNLHAYIISFLRDPAESVNEIKRFLPYVNNWATCDSLRPTLKPQNKASFEEFVLKLVDSEETYTKRFSVEMLMIHFLGKSFKKGHALKISAIRSDEYYINMMIAWYFATALIANREDTLPYLEKKSLSPWVHNKTIQKALESYRIDEELKRYLRTLKIR